LIFKDANIQFNFYYTITSKTKKHYLLIPLPSILYQKTITYVSLITSNLRALIE
jgi:hypothetical protein